jgi:hypothetical protein
MKKVALMVSLSLFPRLLAAQELDIRSLVGENWYGLYMNGEKAGYALDSVSVADDGTVCLVEDAHFRVKMSGVNQDMRIYLKRLYGKDGALQRIEQQVEDPGGPKQFDAHVDGDTMTLVTEVAGVTKEQRLPKPKESLRDALKQVELVGKNAKVGDELRFSMFEPMYEKEIDGVSRIVGIEQQLFEGAPTRVFRIQSTLKAMGIESTTYVAENGITLEDHIADILTMRLEPKEIAQDVSYSNDVIIANAAMVDKPIDNPRDRAVLRLRIHGPLTSQHLFNDERQQVAASGDGFAFVGKRVLMEGFAAARIPIQNDAVNEWLKPTLFVQSEDPRLVKKAREIVGEEKDAFAVATTLCHWVYQNVRTTFSARLSNALEVLEHPEGDCTEHSILFIGLARAAGLPAREVAGLIYVADDKPRFYFHQWAMVWVGKWIDVDPTFNQPAADATHIKLAEGDLFEQAKLIPTIGRLRIEVEEGPEKETS